MNAADRLVAELGLEPHPEGGFFREIYRAELGVESAAHSGRRSASTGIYFLLRAGEFSALHRVRSDELWHHYRGDAIELHLLDGSGSRVLRVGADIEGGERPVAVVPAGVLQAARVAVGAHGYALAGCTVAPGFEFADFELPSRAELLREQPSAEALIVAFTR